MKCEKCHENEANYYYRETINGKSTQKHLCSHCAEAEGLTSAFDWRGESLLEEFFEPFFTRGSLLSGFGMPGLARTMLRPMLAFPRFEIGMLSPQPREATEEKAEEGTSPAVDEGLKARREAEMLREQLRSAVEREDYEKAIELRDRLRALEKEE